MEHIYQHILGTRGTPYETMSHPIVIFYSSVGEGNYVKVK